MFDYSSNEYSGIRVLFEYSSIVRVFEYVDDFGYGDRTGLPYSNTASPERVTPGGGEESCDGS